MKRWQDELTKHPIFTSLKQFLDAFEAEIEIEDPVIVVEKARFGKFTALLRDTLNKLEPDLAPIDLINQIQSQIQNHGALETARSLIREKNPKRFRELNDQINPSLSYVTQLRAAAIGKDTKRSDTEAASVSLETLSRNISKKRADYEASIGQLLSKVEESEARMKVIAEGAEGAKHAFDENINSWTSQVNAAIERYQKQFTSELSEIQNKSKDQLKTFFASQDEEAVQKQLELKSQLEAIIADANEKHSKILDLYKLVARDSITGGHKHIADREYNAAQTWRRTTIGSIAVTALWLGYSLIYMEHIVEPEIFFWLQTVKSVSLTALFISFAIYASKQAALHRINERKARSFFLQVQAFDPFIENLPEDKRVELKQALSARIFGSDESEHDRSILENGDFKSFDRAIEYIQKLSKLVGRQ